MFSTDTLSPLEKWREAREEAASILDAIKSNLTVDEKRELLGDELERRGSDPVLYQVVVDPEAKAPKVSMQDVKDMYLQERRQGGTGRNNKNRLDGSASVLRPHEGR